MLDGEREPRQLARRLPVVRGESAGLEDRARGGQPAIAEGRRFDGDDAHGTRAMQSISTWPVISGAPTVARAGFGSGKNVT